jgi:G:T-mismatch repair DNA endonuclease (very short patch repair protein)
MADAISRLTQNPNSVYYSAEYRKKCAQVALRNWSKPEFRKKQTVARSNGCMRRGFKSRAKIRMAQKLLWQDNEYRRKYLPHILKLAIENLSKKYVKTKIEERLEQLLAKHNLPFKYVGNGKCYIGRRCPDFINREKKVVLELFGSFWHNPSLNPKVKPEATEEATKKYYQSKGFNCIVIWDYELKNESAVLAKITLLL